MRKWRCTPAGERTDGVGRANRPRTRSTFFQLGDTRRTLRDSNVRGRRGGDPGPTGGPAGGSMNGSALRSAFVWQMCLITLITAVRPAAATGRAVDIESADGFRIHAAYHAGRDDAPAVLLLHQCDRDGARTGYEGLAERLAGMGFHVLVPDLRGYGASRSERFTGDNWQEAQRYLPEDTEAAFRFLAEQPGVPAERIAVVGASCGGRQAVLLAGTHESIAALVLISTRLGAPMEEALVHAAQRPLLAIAAEGDASAAATARRAFEHSTHAAGRLVICKGAAHGTPLFAEDASLEPAIAAWLEARLTR